MSDAVSLAYVAPEGSIPTLEIPDLSPVRTAHLVGIGGAGMSGIARLLLARGLSVSGSDLKDSPGLALLRGAGALVTIGHREENIASADVVVVSTAIGPENPEVVAARAKGVPVLARAQVLAALMAERRGVAVAGTHGKTTTTSMIAVVLEAAGVDPTYVVGGDLNESGSNARWGSGDVFVAEADESDGSFLLLRPDIAVVTNVEEEHLEFYGDRAQLEAAFVRFCRGAGLIVVCGDDDAAISVTRESGTPARTYGEGPDNEVRLLGWEVRDGRWHGRVRFGDDDVELDLGLPGRHYLLNATAALAVARELGVDPREGADALRRFTGVRRRFELRGSVGGATFVDDYAHHPTEIEVTLDAAGRAMPGERIVAVFQPHRYSRTAALSGRLGRALAGADLVVVTDVYGAGENPVPGVTGKLVVDALLAEHPRKRVLYLPSRADVPRYLAAEVREGDLILTLGAGDITMVPDETIARLGGRP